MNLPVFIAKRYLFSKKSHNVINWISGIAVVGVAIGTMALIVVLSAFNGLENLVISLFDSFDPDIKISIKKGKTFALSDFPSEELKKIEGVAYYADVLEESALLKYRDQQYIATIKGVGNDFVKMSGIDSMITDGQFQLEEYEKPFAIVGQGIAYSLSISVNDLFNPMTVYVPKRGVKVSLTATDAFKAKKIQVGGVFSIQKDFDTEYVIVPIDFARDLLQLDTKVSAVEIGIAEGADEDAVQMKIQELVGDNYHVKNRYQQHSFLYKIMKSEKWAVFLILSFIVILAAFNSIASITMIILDKKKDIGILRSMGADTSRIKKIFLMEGLLINLIGILGGLVLGAGICYAQYKFEIIKFQGNFVADAIPVAMYPTDFLYVFITVFIIGLIAAWLPVRKIQPENIAIE
ncbi:ABC transporter permease [Flavobacteriales bacterium AH-315-E23]|nr:ABC transporter permease [Flavobacteriales bacterium AH-315-E23]